MPLPIQTRVEQSGLFQILHSSFNAMFYTQIPTSIQLRNPTTTLQSDRFEYGVVIRCCISIIYIPTGIGLHNVTFI